VQLADGSGDAFLHVSVVERSGHNAILPGATLKVRAAPGPKGPQISEILSVDSSTGQEEPPRRARPERPMYSPATRAAVEESGTVKWYNAMNQTVRALATDYRRSPNRHSEVKVRSYLVGCATEARFALVSLLPQSIL
jgi:cold shock CspA family protein